MCGILFEATAVFLGCLATHVAIWRIRRPVTYRGWLPLLVMIFLVAGPAAAWWLVAGRVVMPADPRPDFVTEWAAVLLLLGAASAVYIIGYTLLSAFSPSIEIMKRLETAADGLTHQEIDVPFLRTTIGGERVMNLLDDGLLIAEGDTVRLGPRALAIARIALFYRHAIGLPDGSGG
jgi:hypothetical protein